MKHITLVSKAQTDCVDNITGIIEEAIADLTAAINELLKKEEETPA